MVAPRRGKRTLAFICMALVSLWSSVNAHVNQSPLSTGKPILQLGHFSATVLALTSGVLHGLGMALRKVAGTKEQYWTVGAWWFGVGCDAFAGILFMTSIPFAPAVVLLPSVAVAQISSGYVCGICFFGEARSRRGSCGILCAALGVVLVTVQDFGSAAAVQMESLFDCFVQPQFVLTNGVVLGVILAAYLSGDRSMLYVLLAAYCDGGQFLASRVLSTSILAGDDVIGSTFLGLCCFKLVLVLLYLHFQQIALRDSLSRVAAAYPIVAALMPSLLGTAFFGDHLHVTPSLGVAVATASLGVALLSDSTKGVSMPAALQENLL